MRAALTRVRLKRAAVAAASVAMAVSLTACGGDDGKKKSEESKERTPASAGQKPSAPAEEDESEVLATVKNAEGVEIVINAARRDAGGFVTVKGRVKNKTGEIFAAPGWQGDEQELAGNSASMAGSSLVDKAGKKRYLILRDTDGRCLCTKFEGFTPGAEQAFYAQFPAPPETTSEVDFQVPTMPIATIKISG
ncbi:hypothetical protein [Streptomyces sp. NPDC050504]|uniref:hypothetical protein n=1 Tax=Streptomyces sp. NPDC050504 TaxID=3365618 RepID=UPI0037BD7026